MKKLLLLLSLTVLNCIPFKTKTEIMVAPIQIHAPAIYFAWYTQLEDCTKLTGHFENIVWFVVPAPSFPCHSDTNYCLGMWAAGHTILLAGPSARDSVIVKHEMLHDLLDGDSNHKNKFFKTCTGDTEEH